METLHTQMETAKVELAKPFAQEGELKAKEERLSELNALLNMDTGNEGGEREYSDIDDEEDTRISADRPAQKMSVIDRLRQMQSKVNEQKGEKTEPTKKREQEI